MGKFGFKNNLDVFVNVIAATLVALLLFVFGFVGCYFYIYKIFDSRIRVDERAYTLGRVINPRDKAAVANSYLNPKNAIEYMDDYSWAVPTIPTPFVGTAPSPGKHGVAYINKQQFRSRDEVANPKPSGVYRIFLVGGSVAFGSGAPSDESTIAGYLQGIMNKQLSQRTNVRYEVVTAANTAWSSTQERIVIENVLSELSPDMVISLSGVNDVHWGMLGRNVLWYRSYADEYYKSLIDRVLSITFRPALAENTEIIQTNISPDVVSERLVNNVLLSKYALSRVRSDYIFILQPVLPLTRKSLSEYERTKLKSTEKNYVSDCYARFYAGLKKLEGDGFKFIDFTGIFDDVGERQIFIDSYHFGDRGNEIIANGIYSKIAERVLASASMKSL